ncbi:MAG: GatB/YqeY domain-containing protein [Candidatus Hydrogenedens sp.]|nr:GatB/YqeY domain-containing protein [Candidatus Hydrogenedens sp.]
MSIKAAIQDAMKDALRAKNSERLSVLRMAKGALLLAEKAGPKEAELSDADATQALRSEVRKRVQSIEQFAELGKTDEVESLKREIEVIESFLPQQLTSEQAEARVRDYLAAHPELNHPGKLTGALKKELGDLVDGKVLNEVCRKVLEG